MIVCLAANTLSYPSGGGHFWAYLNWALSLRKIGCRILWMEFVESTQPPLVINRHINLLSQKLSTFGITEIVLWSNDPQWLHNQQYFNCISVQKAATLANLLLNQYYAMPQQVVSLFKKSILLDIDPGLFQCWLSRGEIEIATYDHYFTIGETVGKPGSQIPVNNINWCYTAPCVALDHWPLVVAPTRSPFTTITHWTMDLWEQSDGEWYQNDKKSGFLPFLSLPKKIDSTLELALFLAPAENDEKIKLEELGWQVKDSQRVCASPQQYQKYIQQSSGEFSCVKPSCIRLQNAWVSDRSICYLASGKPVIVQNTGASSFLPDRLGMLRFSTIEEAMSCFAEVETNYQLHCDAARALAEEYFNGEKLATNMLNIVFSTKA